MNFKKRLALTREIYRPYYGPLFMILLISTGIQTSSFAVPYIYGKIVDGLIKAKSMDYFVVLVVLTFVISMARYIFEHYHARIHTGQIAYDIEDWISEVTLKRVMRLSIGQVVNHNSGFRHDVIKRGEAALREMVECLIFQMIPSILRALVAIVGLFLISWLFGTVVLASLAGYIAASIWANQRIQPGLKRLSKIESRISTFYWEIIKHLRLVSINSQEERIVKEYTEKCRDYSEQGKQQWLSYFRSIIIFREPMSAVGQTAIAIAAVYLVRKGNVTTGEVVIAMSWTMMAFQSIVTAGGIQRTLIRLSVHIGKYFELLEILPAVVQAANPTRPENFIGRIEFRNVSFAYPTFKGRNEEINGDSSEKRGTAVKNLSFIIKPGTTCAFVGHSGAGKSTVVNLLMRAYDPDQGQILIDNHDLRLLDISLWRKAVGCVDQEARLWDASLRYNMAFGMEEETTDSELHKLAERTLITEFFDRLDKNPFDTDIGENGYQLSGGQRQRVAISRAIGKNPKILIFDEATNALDPLNESLIRKAIETALAGRTGIIIAHRLSTVRYADQIIVFDDGQIVGNGKHEELLKTCMKYQQMVEREIGTLMS